MTKAIYAELDLDGNKIVDLGNPTDPQDAATKAYVDQEIDTTEEWVIDLIGTNAEYFLTPTLDALGAPYYVLDVTPSHAAETSFTTGSIGSDTNTLLYTGIVSVANGPSSIKAGLQSAHLHALRVSGARALRLYASLHVMAVGGSVGAAFVTSEMSDLLTTASAEYDFDFILAADQAFATDERLVMRVYVNSNGGTPNATVGRISVAGNTSSHLTVGISANAFDHIYIKQTDFIWNEVPGGTINGTNDAFTLAHAPLSSTTMMLFKNGILQRAGAGNDFTLSTLTITFLAGNIPQTDDILACTYQW